MSTTVDTKIISDRLNAFLTARTQSPVALHEPCCGEPEIAAVTQCVRSGWVSYLGPHVTTFESQLSKFTDIKFAISVVNGTTALHLALHLAGIGPGDEVIVPPLTFIATANAVAHTGATPHFVDINPVTFGLCPIRLADHLRRIAKSSSRGIVNRLTGKRLAAVVPVHVFGHPAETSALAAVCAEFGLSMIEDAAEALGSFQAHRHVGGDGQMAVLSFSGNKILTTGGGGALLTNDPTLAECARHIASTAKMPHAWEFNHDMIGFNYRMPSLNASLGTAQMDTLQQTLAKKRELAQAYQECFRDISGVTVMTEPPGTRSNYWLNSLILNDTLLPERDTFLAQCAANGIHCRPAWNLLCNQIPYANAPRGDKT